MVAWTNSCIGCFPILFTLSRIERKRYKKQILWFICNTLWLRVVVFFSVCFSLNWRYTLDHICNNTNYQIYNTISTVSTIIKSVWFVSSSFFFCLYLIVSYQYAVGVLWLVCSVMFFGRFFTCNGHINDRKSGWAKKR